MNGSGEAPEIRTCSACAGDYEDPDCTAWASEDAEDGVDEEERDAVLDAPAEEFPAEQR